MNLKSVIITWSTILKQDFLVTTQYLILVSLINQNWLHFGKQYTYFFFSPSTQQPLCLSSSGWTAKVVATEK